ncbi:MAG: M16 family metallopeptidase [Phycisphaerales bacterium]
MSPILSHLFPNGLILLAEPMPGVQSVAMTALVPAGSACEPAEQQGLGAILHEMLFRGAGDLDARAHSDALDTLGVQRGANVQTHHLRLGATLLGDRLPDALPLLIDMLRRPRLDDSSFGPARDMAVQSIDALEDEPQQKLMVELRRAHLPAPLDRSGMGLRDHLLSITPDQTRRYRQRNFVPQGTILAFAGKLDFDPLRDQIAAWTADWQTPSDHVPLRLAGATKSPSSLHVPAQSTQQHIGLAYSAVPETDPMSMIQRVAVAVLSGGMSGRLFTEVREKRGLCYAVFAAYQSIPPAASVFAYSGTTTERAAQTLDVLRNELIRLSDGVERDEFDRAIVGLKSRIVMQGESTSARATAIAGDQFVYGYPRTLDDLASQVDAVTLDKLNDFVAAHRPTPENMTLVNIGPAPLT